MTRVLLILIFLFPVIIFAQKDSRSNFDDLKKEIEVLRDSLQQIEKFRNDINYLKRDLEQQSRINEQSFNGISTQLDSSAHNLTIFSIIFTVFALILAIYVSVIERKIVKIHEESKEIKHAIENSVGTLYNKLKTEETRSILRRLSEVPEDVTNLGRSLLSRKLESEDEYNAIRNAFNKLLNKKSPKEKYLHYYRMILFQHFLYFPLYNQDEKIIEELSNNYVELISDSFENDMKKSTEDFIRAIVDNGLSKNKIQINKFMNAVGESSYKDDESIYETVFDSLNTARNRFNFYDYLSESDAKEKYEKTILRLLNYKKLTKSYKEKFNEIKRSQQRT